jgi:lysophospholipase L1-like esterase
MVKRPVSFPNGAWKTASSFRKRAKSWRADDKQVENTEASGYGSAVCTNEGRSGGNPPEPASITFNPPSLLQIMSSFEPFLGKGAAAVGTMMLLLSIPYASKSLARYRVFDGPPPEAKTETAEPVVGETSLNSSEQRASSQNALPEEKEAPQVDPEAIAREAGSIAIEQLDALGPFFAQLRRTEQARGLTPSGDADAGAGGPTDAPRSDGTERDFVARILHYGDSVITSDYISGTLRRRFQARFGDAGHGFVLTAKAWEWYFHNDVTHYATEGWSASRVSGPFSKEAAYGLGGAMFRGSPGASATFGAATRGDYGRNLGRADIFYEELENGGDFEVKAPGQEPQVVHTKGEKRQSAKASYRVTDGETKVSIRVLGKGEVRIYGAALERDKPGIVYDALGALGARAKMWEPVPEEHWRQQLSLRKPHLVVLQFGTNESEDGAVAKDYESTLLALVEKLKHAAPDAAILIAAPLDRAERDDGGRIRSAKPLVKIVELQAKVAKASGVGFWNTWKAMGGEGSMAKWLNHKPQLCSGDLTHPTPAGAEVIGDLFYKAVLAGYQVYLENERRAARPTKAEPAPTGTDAPKPKRPQRQ